MKIRLEDFRIIENKNERIRAAINVVINNSLVIQDVKIIEDNDGYFVAMPSMQKSDGTFVDIVQPITADVVNILTETILDAFHTREYNSGILEEMHITDVKMHKVEVPNSNIKAIATVILNDEFAINCIRIIEDVPGNQSSIKIVLPNWQVGEQCKNIAYFIDKYLTEEFVNKIFDEYKNIL